MINPNTILHGSALDQLKTIDSESIDLIVTDPPYGYFFMAKDWDKAVVGVDTWKECLRVLKPGAFAFIMSSPRQDVLCKMILNLIDAGFETNFTSLYHTYASGFPKAANTTKLLQKRSISKPELEGSYLGLQPKPALEIILTVMKPLSEKTFVDQALANQKGITWLDDCRIPYQDITKEPSYRPNYSQYNHNSKVFKGFSNDETTLEPEGREKMDDKGRFPANLLVEDDVLNDGKITKSHSQGIEQTINTRMHFNVPSKDIEVVKNFGDSGSFSRYFSLDAWTEKTLPFLIVPKAAKAEKGNACIHPTVKPLKLMSYLITMGSREGDIILDPFCGSGTVLIAAHELHRRWIGIELNAEYVEIANQRLRPHKEQTRLL